MVGNGAKKIQAPGFVVARIRNLLDAGKYDAALKECRFHRMAYRDDFELAVLQSRIYFASGNYGAVWLSLEELQKLRPGCQEVEILKNLCIQAQKGDEFDSSDDPTMKSTNSVQVDAYDDADCPTLDSEALIIPDEIAVSEKSDDPGATCAIPIPDIDSPYAPHHCDDEDDYLDDDDLATSELDARSFAIPLAKEQRLSEMPDSDVSDIIEPRLSGSGEIGGPVSFQPGENRFGDSWNKVPSSTTKPGGSSSPLGNKLPEIRNDLDFTQDLQTFSEKATPDVVEDVSPLTCVLSQVDVSSNPPFAPVRQQNYPPTGAPAFQPPASTPAIQPPAMQPPSLRRPPAPPKLPIPVMPVKPPSVPIQAKSDIITAVKSEADIENSGASTQALPPDLIRAATEQIQAGNRFSDETCVLDGDASALVPPKPASTPKPAPAPKPAPPRLPPPLKASDKQAENEATMDLDAVLEETKAASEADIRLEFQKTEDFACVSSDPVPKSTEQLIEEQLDPVQNSTNELPNRMIETLVEDDQPAVMPKGGGYVLQLLKTTDFWLKTLISSLIAFVVLFLFVYPAMWEKTVYTRLEAEMKTAIGELQSFSYQKMSLGIQHLGAIGQYYDDSRTYRMLGKWLGTPRLRELERQAGDELYYWKGRYELEHQSFRKPEDPRITRLEPGNILQYLNAELERCKVKKLDVTENVSCIEALQTELDQFHLALRLYERYWLIQAEIDMERNDFDSARKSIDKADSVWDVSPETVRLRSVLYAHDKGIDEAIDYLNSVSPELKNERIEYSLAKYKALKGQKDGLNALEAYGQDKQESQKRRSEAIELLSIHNMVARNVKEVDESLSAALELNPYSCDIAALRQLVRFQRYMGDYSLTKEERGKKLAVNYNISTDCSGTQALALMTWIEAVARDDMSQFTRIYSYAETYPAAAAAAVLIFPTLGEVKYPHELSMYYKTYQVDSEFQPVISTGEMSDKKSADISSVYSSNLWLRSALSWKELLGAEEVRDIYYEKILEPSIAILDAPLSRKAAECSFAMRHLNNTLYRSVPKACKELSGLSPRSAFSKTLQQTLLGQAYFTIGDYASAFNAFQSAGAMTPTVLLGIIQSGFILYLQDGYYRTLDSSIEKAIMVWRQQLSARKAGEYREIMDVISNKNGRVLSAEEYSSRDAMDQLIRMDVMLSSSISQPPEIKKACESFMKYTETVDAGKERLGERVYRQIIQAECYYRTNNTQGARNILLGKSFTSALNDISANTYLPKRALRAAETVQVNLPLQ